MRLARALLVLVLILASVSVGTLVYARGAAREGEVTVRRALGASRGRIVLQMFVEALVLASMAGVVGVAIARWGLGYLNAALDSAYIGGMPYWVGGRVGPSTLLVVVGLGCGSEAEAQRHAAAAPAREHVPSHLPVGQLLARGVGVLLDAGEAEHLAAV